MEMKSNSRNPNTGMKIGFTKNKKWVNSIESVLVVVRI
jgi:hypothetical protein